MNEMTHHSLLFPRLPPGVKRPRLRFFHSCGTTAAADASDAREHCSIAVRGRRGGGRLEFEGLHEVADGLFNDGTVSTRTEWSLEEVRLPRTGLEAEGGRLRQLELEAEFHYEKGALGIDALAVHADRKCHEKR